MPSTAAFYDRHLRNPESKRFYNSAAWKRCRANVLAATPWCIRCNNGMPAAHVHHSQPITTPEGWDRRLHAAGLMPLCIACHNIIEREAQAQPPAVSTIAGIYQPQEDDEFYFDADAGEKPIRFIEKFVRHFEGRWAGEKIRLLDWQKQTIRTLYGWKRRADHRRRFTQLFLLSGKGAGKTPFLSSVGIFETFAGGEKAAHIVSMATTYPQAMLTMDFAKKSIAQDPQLDALAERTQYEIRVPRTNAKWTSVSGNFSGRAGFRPSTILADEIWEYANSKNFDSVTANLFKREQPLLLLATNAGESRNCFAWTLYEQAKAVLAGTSPRKDLLPVIFEAPESLEWDSEAAARAACPSIPEVITFDTLRPKIVQAKENPAAKAEYCRLHLSQWVQGGRNKWLDLAVIDAATQIIDPDTIKDAPTIAAIDLSEGDDLCSAVFVHITPSKFYIRCLNWICRDVAERYEAKGQGQYSKWEKAGEITLLDELTVGPAVRRRIAGEIIDEAKGFKLQAVCYDRYRADEAVAVLEAAGIKTIAIGQGWGVSPGCAELERRLKEHTIVFEPNALMRTAAEIVEVKTDDRGNTWPVKPNAKGKYAGTRSAKIDPIAALVTALVEARKHSFPPAQRVWNGGVWIL